MNVHDDETPHARYDETATLDISWRRSQRQAMLHYAYDSKRI